MDASKSKEFIKNLMSINDTESDILYKLFDIIRNYYNIIDEDSIIKKKNTNWWFISVIMY